MFLVARKECHNFEFRGWANRIMDIIVSSWILAARAKTCWPCRRGAFVHYISLGKMKRIRVLTSVFFLTSYSTQNITLHASVLNILSGKELRQYFLGS